MVGNKPLMANVLHYKSIKKERDRITHLASLSVVVSTSLLLLGFRFGFKQYGKALNQ